MIKKIKSLFSLKNYSLKQVSKVGIDQNVSKGVVQYKIGEVSILLYPYPDDFEDIEVILSKRNYVEENSSIGTFIIEHEYRIIDSKKSPEKFPNEATFIEIDMELDREFDKEVYW